MTKQPINVVSFPAAAPAKTEASHVRIWSKPVVALGYTALPSVMIQAQRRLGGLQALLRGAAGLGAKLGYQAQRRLGITPLQFNILVQLLDYWREPSRAPFPSKVELAERIGVKPKTIQTNIRALEKAQLVTREMRKTAAGDWNSNIYHLDGLVERIKTLVPEFEAAREERNKAKAAQKRAQTPKGQRKQP